MIIEILTIITNLSVLSLVGYTAYKYIKIRNKYLRLKNLFLKMDAKEILGEKVYKETENDVEYKTIQLKRDRLSMVIAGGNSRKYLGKEISSIDLDNMSTEEINKLYCRYEARLGACMTKTLGNTIINLGVMFGSKFVKFDSEVKLIEDLEEDPFIDNALNSWCCEAYYKYGMLLAPLTASLTIAKHIDFSKSISDETENIENIPLKNDE